ncbi:hypothetical protein [Chamaesiphon sp. GL140_3_metabinner_50]|uniref:ParB N-terminal domain-containing protein n=1 Tax=Chamaesiphon sp. GL140_3_metabinner_50 TaxID=2970812 RepID=UPI0025DF980F|nr:hypothetical protein [Chamaesiphon sp. GL140_3_metabinner_50]
MIECRLVDIKDIISMQPKSNFQIAEIEKLANAILATEGLIRPLILQNTGLEQYTVIEGDLEYYAAARAKEKNLVLAEHVNAFIIPAKLKASAIEQITIVSERSSKITSTTPDLISLDNLIPALSSAISAQIKPILEQLAEHKKILDALDKSRIEPVAVLSTVEPPIIAPPAIAPLVIEPPVIAPPIIDPLTSPLDLINTLSEKEIVLRMQLSGISKTVIKLIPDIVAKRNTQAERKFNSWDVIKKEVKGLGATTIKQIIEKFK